MNLKVERLEEYYLKNDNIFKAVLYFSVVVSANVLLQR